MFKGKYPIELLSNFARARYLLNFYSSRISLCNILVLVSSHFNSFYLVDITATPDNVILSKRSEY